MKHLFVIEDEMHSEQCGEFSSFNEAAQELHRRASIPWDQAPNQCPCTNWRACMRNYEIVEYDSKSRPWHRIKTTPAMRISADGVAWSLDFQRT